MFTQIRKLHPKYGPSSVSVVFYQQRHSFTSNLGLQSLLPCWHHPMVCYDLTPDNGREYIFIHTNAHMKASSADMCVITHTQVFMYASYVRTYIHERMYMYTHTNAYTYTLIHTHIYVDAGIHIHVHINEGTTIIYPVSFGLL